METYTQLALEQRCQIYALRKSGITQREIAEQVGCSQSTVSREISRNTGGNGYRYQQAQRYAEERRACVPRTIKMDAAMITTVESMLRGKLSPEQISGALRVCGKSHVSHERIYQHIWQNKREGGDLYASLRRRGKKYLKRYGGKTTRGRIIGRVGIEKRPAVVDKKSRVVDWEIDTVIGAHQKGVLVTIVERKTKFTVAAFTASKRAADVTATAIELLMPYKDAVLTITADNGKEFAWHHEITKALDTQVYFARPYHSWERGLNENTNGLLRQYWPKGMPLTGISDEECKHVIEELNNRPRKTLKYKTPSELMARHMKSIAL